MRLFKVILPFAALGSTAVAQDLSSLISNAGPEASSLISKYGPEASSLISKYGTEYSSITSKYGGDYSSIIASVSSAYESILSKHPGAVSSIESFYSSILPSSAYAEFTSILGDITGGSGSGGGNAGAVIAPSYTLGLMGAAAAGIFGLAVAL